MLSTNRSCIHYNKIFIKQVQDTRLYITRNEACIIKIGFKIG